jgi:outer membrane protein, heavy metal efflux system
LQLLRDREQQIETAVAYVEALREYWMARTDLSQVVSGRLPSANGLQGTVGGSSMKTNGNERH